MNSLSGCNLFSNAVRLCEVQPPIVDNRSTPNVDAALSNFQGFLGRDDIELIVATTNSEFRLEGPGRTIYLEKPVTKDSIWDRVWNRAGRNMYFMWRPAAEVARGEWIVIVADDMLLSNNLFDRANQNVQGETKVFQPTLLDPQGYVVCGEYFRTYTCAIVRRKLVFDFDLTSELWCDAKWLHRIRKSCDLSNARVFFRHRVVLLALGLPHRRGR